MSQHYFKMLQLTCCKTGACISAIKFQEETIEYRKFNN